MNFEVPDEVRAATTMCPKDFSCLATGKCGEPDVCEFRLAVRENVLLLQSREDRDCPYRVSLGDSSQFCMCPTRSAIHKRYGK